jgi:pimeloyl-ACP methyl ester carboxylesterase
MAKAETHFQASGPQVLTSADGTRIACEMAGSGRPVILIGGILSDRSSLAEVAVGVAAAATAVTYDRRGRGESDQGVDYSVSREIEDLAAIAAMFDAPPVLFGHSSGAGLAIEAAAAGLRVAALILYEPPYGPDDADSRAEAAAFARSIESMLEAGDRSGAVACFFEAMGLPPGEVDALSSDPGYVARAPTMSHDFAVMGQIDRGGAVPTELLERVQIPTLVLTGERSPPFFGEIAAEVAAALPHGSLSKVPEADHSARSDNIPRVVLEFVSSLGAIRP